MPVEALRILEAYRGFRILTDKNGAYGGVSNTGAYGGFRIPEPMEAFEYLWTRTEALTDARLANRAYRGLKEYLRQRKGSRI
jgi:hypothetical protein